jgi:hypothetical protein
MINPFKLKGTFGAEYSVDGDDIYRTKKALNKLGYFEEKEFVNPYADMRMIDGLKSFQRTRGLQADGVMKPDGPTARELGKALADERPQPRQRSLVAKTRHKPIPRHLPTYMPTRTPHRPQPKPQPRPWYEPPLAEDDLFRFLGDVGRGRRNNPRDVVAARRALGWAGEMVPSRGADELRADDNLFAAIDRFQARTGVKRDGWMGKGGETENALNAEIGPKVAAHTNKSANKGGDPKADAGNTEVAMWGQVLRQAAPHLKRLLPGVGAGVAGQKAAEETLKNIPNERRDITPPPSPVPPNQPPEPDVPDRTETPAKAPVIEMDLSRPIPDATKPTIFINPTLPEHMKTTGMIIDRNETEATKAQIDRIRDEFINQNPELEHHRGGRDAATGNNKKEYYAPGTGQAFPLPGRETGDGRKGSGYTDLTFRSKDKKTFWHIQTVDIDRDGKPTARELENAERIRRGLHNNPKEVHHIILVPKPGPVRVRR